MDIVYANIDSGGESLAICLRTSVATLKSDWL